VGRNRVLPTGEVFNSYLPKPPALCRARPCWGRIENLDRTSELLLGKQPEPLGFEEHPWRAYRLMPRATIRVFSHPISRHGRGGQITFLWQAECAHTDLWPASSWRYSIYSPTAQDNAHTHKDPDNQFNEPRSSMNDNARTLKASAALHFDRARFMFRLTMNRGRLKTGYLILIVCALSPGP